MPDQTAGLRPPTETFARRGWRLTVVDAPAVFATAISQPVQLLRGTSLGSPARLTVAPAVDGLALTLDLRTGDGGPRLAVLGNDPIGYLLSRRSQAGDPRAVRVLDGLEAAVGEVSRRLGRPAPPLLPAVSFEPGERLAARLIVDAATGLEITATRYAPRSGSGEVLTLRASLPAATAAGPHLAALVDAAVAVLGRAPRGDVVLTREADTDQVTLDQVGGLGPVVAQFREVAISFRHPGAMARWGARRPQGILLYGPPGTGKTMLARALATEIGGTLREIRTPEILDKWLGAAERNLKRIFQEARRYTGPTVLLFDEFDSIIGYVGAPSDSGGHAVNAVAGLFKQEMNTLVRDNPNVIVVATTNFPDLIDESLIRSGRFDLWLRIPMPDAAGRTEIITRIIQGLIRTHERDGFRMFADDLDLTELGEASTGLSGADLAEALRRAQLGKALQEAGTGQRPTPISQQDLRDRIAQLRQRPAATG
jgi:transitional endoplasmic reticulum ATPase